MPGSLVGVVFVDQKGVPMAAPDPPTPPLGQRLARPVADFLSTETAGGIVLLAATVVALSWANSPLGSSYESLWGTELSLRLGSLQVARDLRHWVNEGLMALFFLVVGLEIKRELVVGELRELRRAALPVLAAVGGMIVPAGLYLALNGGGEGAPGWAIPMATDIAFAVGVLALLAPGASASLKVFLLTLAIVDDIGAIVVIALVYTGGIGVTALGAAALALACMVGLRALRVGYPPPFFILGALAWFALLQSGVHATIAGVAVGLMAPARAANPSSIRRLPGFERTLSEEGSLGGPDARLARQAVLEVTPVTERLSHDLHPWTSFVVIPLFALANAGVRLDLDALGAAASSPIAWGIVLGLVAGKILGVAGAAALAVRAGVGRLPAEMTLRELPGLGAIAGIGFTVAIFITTLAFDDPALQEQAKIGVLAASLLAAMSGALALRYLSRGRRSR